MVIYITIVVLSLLLAAYAWRNASKHEDKFTGRFVAVIIVLVGVFATLACAATMKV